MASVETTTIRVRRNTHERLQKEAELTGQSVTQVLEEAADLLEEAKCWSRPIATGGGRGRDPGGNGRDEARDETGSGTRSPAAVLPDDD